MFWAKRRFVMVSTMRGQRKILLRDIDYIKGDGKYTYFYLKHTAGGEEKFLEDRSYGYWKETLRDCDFVEIKKGYLINFANVTEMEDGAVVFENGTSITCSARKRRMIRDYFGRLTSKRTCKVKGEIYVDQITVFRADTDLDAGILQLPMREREKYYALAATGSGGIFHLGIYRRLWRK